LSFSSVNMVLASSFIFFLAKIEKKDASTSFL